MRRLTHPTRRRFGRGLATALTLAGLPRAPQAHDGAHDGARAGAHAVEVRINRFAFDPARVEIEAGDSVSWINGDLVPHTATAGDGAWDTGALEQGDAGPITFPTAGEHPYVCAFHPHMEGVVVVRPKPGG